jgi:adenylate cyclase
MARPLNKRLTRRFSSRFGETEGHKKPRERHADIWTGALHAFQRGLQLTPDDPELNVRMSYYLMYTGRANEAIERSAKAIRINPLFPPPSHREAMGMGLMIANRHEEAVNAFISIPHPDYFIHVYAAGCLVKLGRLDEAREQGQKASKLRPDWATRDWRNDEIQNKKDRDHVMELVRLAAAVRK